MTRLILASKSPRRKKLLEQIGLTFDVEPSKLNETYPLGSSPETIVRKLSSQKAGVVSTGKKNAVIIAADTIVVLNDRILGQPTDYKDAYWMLRALSGLTHKVYTGVTLVRTDAEGEQSDNIQFVEQTKVTFSSLTDHEIDAYIKHSNPFDKAGSYGIQDDRGCLFVSGIEGDYYNVVGFPLHKFYLHIKKFAPEIMFEVQNKLT